MKKHLTILAAALFAAGNASATLLLHDPVLVQTGAGAGYNLSNGTPAGSVSGQNTTAVGIFGYTGGFHTGSSLFQACLPGLDYPANVALQSQGGAFKIYWDNPSVDRSIRTVTRDINPITGPSINNTLYMSALVRAEAGYMFSVPNQDGTGVGIGLFNTPFVSTLVTEQIPQPHGGGVLIGFHRNGAKRNLVAWIASNPVLLVEDAADDTTYFVVMRMDFNFGGTDTFSMAVNPVAAEQYDVVCNFAMLTPSNPSFRRAGMSGSFLSYKKSAWFDEFRVGTEWNDVAPFNVAFGAITPVVTPSAASVNVAVAIPGINGALTFAWGDAPGNLANTNEEFNVSATIYNFPINGFNRGEMVYYHATLSTLLPVPATDTRSGSFPIAYDYAWNGSANGNWDNAANWTPNGIPDFAGDSVNISHNAANTRAVNLLATNTANTVTLGRLTATHAANAGIDLANPGNATLVMHNLGGPAEIRANLANGSWLHVRPPLQLAGATRAGTTGRVAGCVMFYDDITGPGRLELAGGYYGFNVPAGATRVITPGKLAVSGGDVFIRKAGPGTLVFEGGSGAWGLPYSHNPKPGDLGIGGGGALVLSGYTLTNNQSQANGWYNASMFMFDGDNNTLVISNGSQVVYLDNFQTYSNFYNVDNSHGNTILVTGPGSRFYMTSIAVNASNNTFRVEDGGYACLHLSDLRFQRSAYFTGFTGLVGGRPPTFIDAGINCLIKVGDGNPARASILDLNGRALLGNGVNSAIVLAAGGVATNGNITVENNNRLQLEGGKYIALATGRALTLQSGATLAPVLGPALRDMEGYSIRVNTCTLATGANGNVKLAPINPNRESGTFKLIETTAPMNLNNLDFIPPKNGMTYTLITTPTTLSLHCVPTPTLLLVR